MWSLHQVRGEGQEEGAVTRIWKRPRALGRGCPTGEPWRPGEGGPMKPAGGAGGENQFLSVSSSLLRPAGTFIG